MKRARVLASMLTLSLLSGLLGCDVAVVALLASKSGGSNSKNSAPPGPDVRFRLWVAQLGVITGAAEQAELIGRNGDPDPLKWTQWDETTTSREYPMPTPGSYDAILIQATENQAYEIDAFEVIDATGTTIVTPTTVFADKVTGSLSLAQGPPDGLGLLTAATPTARSFVFMKHSSAITSFRINVWKQGAARISGDVEWAYTHTRPGDQRAAGAGVNSAGTTYLSLKEGILLFMMRITSLGSVTVDSGNNALTSLENTVPAEGSASIVIDSGDNVFVGTTKDAGSLQIYKYVGIGQIPASTIPVLSSPGAHRIAPNGLALNSAGDLLFAAGADSGGATGINHYIRKFRGDTGGDMWALSSPAPPAPPLDLAKTYWYAVAADGGQNIFYTGDMTALLVGSADTYTSKVVDTSTRSSNGGVTEVWNNHTEASGVAPARGQSIGVDGNHNIYVAGFCTGTGLDSFIVTYDGVAVPTPTAIPFFALTRTGNDEFLDIAVESDGTVYATGYETNGAQGEDLVLYKIAANKDILWKRTVNFANLADRGVKVMLTPTHVIVSGEVGVAAGNIDIHVRKYVK